MLRYDRRFWFLAAALAALAGYIDAIGFLTLGGFFISFMSGNSTRLAVGLAGGPVAAATAVGLILLFVGGVVAGTLVGTAAGERRKTAVLALVTILLVAAALLGGLPRSQAAVAPMTLAMGAMNATFQRDGEVSIGVTYMTGTLVKMGQRLAAALTGGSALAWVPYALLWAGLVGGAICGAALFSQMGMTALWLAALVAAGACGAAHWINRTETRQS